jgi:aminoglycoside phosphotransferase (APT) family kinase protein
MDSSTRRADSVTASAGLDLTLGPKLASGRDADVYDLGDGTVLRRNRVASKTSEAEAAIMRAVRAWGYPVPEVHAVSGPDMVLDRVDGPTMLRDLGQRPWMLWQHARTLAKLHRRLHALPAPDWIPTYTSHPSFATLDPGTLPPSSSPSGPGVPAAPDAFLHLDLHPDNVILSPSGPVVIDWRNTRRGDGAIDDASTWLIMATSQVSETGPKHRVVRLLRGLFVAALLRHIDREAATRQLPLVARYRLADRNLLDSERPAIQEMLRRHGFAP